MHRCQNRKQAGFSLPELMVVVAIILLLMVIAMPRYRQAKERAEEAAARATLNGIHTAQEAHRITHGSYAPSFQLLAGHQGGPGTPFPEDPESEEGETGESVMIHQGYIYRLNRTEPEEYTVTAEPVANRKSRPFYSMGHLGNVTVTRGDELGGAGTTPKDEDQNP